MRSGQHGCSTGSSSAAAAGPAEYTHKPIHQHCRPVPAQVNKQPTTCTEPTAPLTGHLLRRLKLLGLSDVQAQLEQLNLLAQLGQLGAGLDGLQEGSSQLALKPQEQGAAQCNDPPCAATHVCMAKCCTFTD